MPSARHQQERQDPTRPSRSRSLHNLRAFLDATNWRCLYGLNLGRGPVTRAAEEAFHAQTFSAHASLPSNSATSPTHGAIAIAPQRGPTPTTGKNGSAAHAAIVARVPQAKFAGPDVSNKMAYVTGFAEDVKHTAPDVVLLTSHYYAMGPAGAPGITLDKLLSPDPKLERDLQIAMAAARNAGLPYRMSEGNSCWNGGQPGVSDTLASALWVADMMLDFASFGCAGVNLHGGGNGFYTPIAGSLAAGFERRPEYFGMKLIKYFEGATLTRSTLDCASDRVRAYAARNAKSQLMIVINKSDQPASIRTALRHAHRQWLLTGPAIDAKQGVSLTESNANALHKGYACKCRHTAQFCSKHKGESWQD